MGQLNLAEFEAMLARRNEERNVAQFHAGIIAAAIYNANPFRSKDARVLDAIDFVPEFSRRSSREQSVEEQIAVLSRVMGCGPKPN